MKKIIVVLMMVVMAGCAKKVDTLAQIEQREFVIKSFNLTEKPTGHITIYDSLARAFENSLAMRTKTLEDIINQQLLKDEYNDILPKIVEVAGYKARHNPDFYFAILGAELETKKTPSNPNHRNALSAVWDMIDFALTYSTAKMYGNPSLLRDAMKRKAMQNLTSDVKLAFYRVAGAEQIEPEVNLLERKLRKAIANYNKQKDSEDLASYGIALKTNLDQVLILKKEIMMAKLELSALLGLGQYTNYKVQPPIDLTTQKLKDYTLQDLEFEALERHKTLGTLSMTSTQEVAFLREQVDTILPDAEFGYKEIRKFDYFQNQAWEEAGLKISWNLISLMNSLQSAITKEEIASLREIYNIATGTAILSEVNISYLRFYQAMNNFKIALTLSEVKQAIAKENEKVEVENITDIDAISKQIEALLSEMKIYYVYGELKDAEDMLLVSIGVKNYPTFISPENIQVIVDGKGEPIKQPVVAVNLDDKIEQEDWATGKDWLDGAVGASDTLKIDEVNAPKPIIPVKKGAAVKSSDALIDVKKYSELVDVANSPKKATVRKTASTPKIFNDKTLQLGSFKSQTRAKLGWSELVSAHPNLGKNAHKIVPVEVADVGTVYRLVVSGNTSGLQKICSELKTELGGSCIIK